MEKEETLLYTSLQKAVKISPPQCSNTPCRGLILSCQCIFHLYLQHKDDLDIQWSKMPFVGHRGMTTIFREPSNCFLYSKDSICT